ncbi:MAG: DinB family protein, partial [Flavisolibacter sp.]
FLKHEYISELKNIPSQTKPNWGKMTFQQMLEHMSDFLRIASGKTVYTDVITPEERLPRMREFIMSDKPFRENTLNPMLSEIPAPVINESVEIALDELQEELNYFFDVFEKNNLKVTRNPIFGDLNYEENVALVYKHAVHHLRQFSEANR